MKLHLLKKKELNKLSIDLTTQQIIDIGKRMELERKQKEKIYTKSYELSKDKDGYTTKTEINKES